MYIEQSKGYYDAPVPKVFQTNYERIRNMNIQEMADFLCRINEGNNPLNTDDFLCEKYCEGTNCECDKILKDKDLICTEVLTANGYCLLAMEWWLKQEAKI